MPEKKGNAWYKYKLQTPKGICLDAKFFIAFLIELASRIGNDSAFDFFWLLVSVAPSFVAVLMEGPMLSSFVQ